MIVFYVMLTGILAARAVGVLGFVPLDDWQAATRVGLAVMFVFTGTAHFNRTREDLIRMVPPGFPNPPALVTVSGIAELTGAVGLLVPTLARTAAWGLILLLIAVFPANIHAASNQLSIAGKPHTPIVPRTILQIIWIGLIWWSVV